MRLLRLLIISVLILGIALAVRPPQSRAQDPCDGIVAPRLSVGGAARVSAGYGLSLKNRPATSGAGAAELTQLPFGTVVSILDGRQCNFGFSWWQLQLSDGTTGWAAEGNSTDYFLEPYTVGVFSYIQRNDGAQIVRYFVTPDGNAQPQTTFNIQPVQAAVGEIWQEVEQNTLASALAGVIQNCPSLLEGTIWETPDYQQNPLTVQVPTLDYDFYPSPDGNKLVLVRHMTLNVPRCNSTLPQIIGMNRVSVLDANGTETELFPYPQNGSVPTSEDRYDFTAQDKPRVYLDEVVWSPQSKYIAFVAAYQDVCAGQGCYRFHMYIENLETGQLYILGEGRHLGWTNGGEQINFFRVLTDPQGARSAHLYTARPDGTARQEVWLPGGAVYVSMEQIGLDLPWAEGGLRVMVGNGGLEEVMFLSVNDRSFTPPIAVPDNAAALNRLSVQLVNGQTTLLWTTIRGEFIRQNVTSGEWTELTSDLAPTGSAPVRVLPFPMGTQALIEMSNGNAYILDYEADLLTPVAFSGEGVAG